MIFLCRKARNGINGKGRSTLLEMLVGQEKLHEGNDYDGQLCNVKIVIH